MSKPEDISQEALSAAEALTMEWFQLDRHSGAAKAIARAILAAEKRGEEREREACAALIKANMLCGDDGSEVLLPRSNPGNKVGFAYADAILKRGEG